MLKLGIVDFDTSHVVAFSQRLNKKGVDADQFVDGAQVILGCPGTSKMSPERIPGFTKTLSEELGVKLVNKPEELIGKIDGVMIESVDGSVHLERVKPFLEAGVPMWLDKPFACSVRDAEAIINLAAKKNVPLFTGSSLRYALEVAEVVANRAEYGAPIAVDVYGVQGKNPHNPGWFNYGIHAVEMLLTLLGPGHTEIKYVAGEHGEHACSAWKNKAVGSVTLTAKGDSPFGFTYIGEKKTKAARVNTAFIYRELLKQIVTFFQTKKAPVPIEESLEIVRFIEGVNKAGAV